MIGKFLNFLHKLREKYPLQTEIARFCIVGGLATVADMLTMALVQWIIEPSLYASIADIFTAKGTGTAYVVGTGLGFLVGLSVNYFLSVLFVFDEKGNSRTAQGVLIFAALSAVGFFIHVGGMWLFNDILKVNAWAVKVVLTLVVLVWNYLSRKFIIFRNGKKEK